MAERELSGGRASPSVSARTAGSFLGYYDRAGASGALAITDVPMANLRRALLFASGGRYVVMGISLASTVVMARLLTPMEFGITVLGTAVLAIAEAFRELGSVAYLVQQRELTQKKTRTVFTVSLIVTLTMTTLLALLSGPLARFYGVPELARYIHVIAISYAIAPFAHPVYALLSRDMAFDKIAAIDMLTALSNTVAAVSLALLGFSYMSLAWAAAISAAVWTLLGFYVRRDFSVYRPSLAEWRSVLAFGAYGSATAVLYRASESLFYLMLGKLLNARTVGLCQRAVLLAQFPERVILAGIDAVALPAFSDQARQGQDLKTAYLNSVEYVTAVQWPALILLCILADPVVSIVLGPQWRDVVPIMRIFAAAHLFNFATSLNYPILVAVGSIRLTVPLAFVQIAISLPILSFAARYGIQAVALSTLITGPLNAGLSVCIVRAHIPFRFWEFAGALKKSVVLSALSAAGPMVIAICYGGRAGLPIAWVGVALTLFCFGWVAGLWIMRHPLLEELRRAGESVARLVVTRCTVRWLASTITLASNHLARCGRARSEANNTKLR